MRLYNGMMTGWDGYGGSDLFGWIFMMVLVGVFIVAVVILAMRLNKKGDAHHESALDILKKRYANGEIDKKEFDEKKKDLSA